MTDDRTASRLDEAGALREDPAMRGLAQKLAGDPAEAEDLLQQAWYLVVQALGRGHVESLRPYFIRVMAREAARVREQSGAALADDLAALSDHDRALAVAGADFESNVDDLLLVRGLLARFRRRRSELTAMVPRRSADPDRYQRAIAAAAEAVLLRTMEQPVSSGDWNEFLRAGYPEWYHADVPAAMLHQRRSRARADARQLLKVLAGDDLLLSPAPPPGNAASQDDGDARTPADAALTALFLQSELVQLPDEAPYDLNQGLASFTTWLDDQAPGPTGKPTQS